MGNAFFKQCQLGELLLEEVPQKHGSEDWSGASMVLKFPA